MESLSDSILDGLLCAAAPEERFAITKALDASATTALAPAALRSRICLAAGNRAVNFIRGRGVTYAEILHDACRALEAPETQSYFAALPSGFSASQADSEILSKQKKLSNAQRRRCVSAYVSEHERRLLSKLTLDIYGGMSVQQRIQFDSQLDKLAMDNGLGGLGKGAALLALGNAGGFATYTLMSTVLSTVSLGTLSFGAYTLASSALSVVLGPVGWIGLGLYGMHKLGAPDKSQVVRLAATCALVSQRLLGSSHQLR